MKYKVYSAFDCIGETNLETRDEGMSVSVGVFFPTDNYESVRPFFQSFNEILEESDFEQQSKLRDQWQNQLADLDLKLHRWDDVEVPTGWIQIYDFWFFGNTWGTPRFGGDVEWQLFSKTE